MCKTQCVLALVALYVGLALSWDIAISQGDELVFYTNESQTGIVHFKSQNLTALVYDEVHSMMLYVDKQNGTDAICSYNLLSMKNKCYIRRFDSNIHSIAFDPSTDTLFFTDTNEKSINWISLKPDSSNNENLLIKMHNRIPNNIAVDSCRGYIYWTNTGIRGEDYVKEDKYMERARFDGSERQLMDENLPVLSVTLDQQTQTICYIDWYGELIGSDLNGQLKSLIMLSDLDEYRSKQLTVTNDNLYWTISGVNYNTVWQLPKSAMSGEDRNVRPKEIGKFINKIPLGLATHYKIKDQIQGLEDCEVLRSLIPKINNHSLNVQQIAETEYTKVAELFCVHGTEVGETSVCKCRPGYIGERCDVSVCENYCLQGDCSFNDQGLPKCRCSLGYSGERCEMYACHGFCLNNGDCSINGQNEPVCQCKSVYVGDRCEVSECLNYCIQGKCSNNQEGLPTCRCNAGYSGEMCEVYACHGYCLNSGVCSLNEKDEPVCQCVGNHEGTRCEAVKDVTINNINSPKRSVTLGDLLSKWRQPSSN